MKRTIFLIFICLFTLTSCNFKPTTDNPGDELPQPLPGEWDDLGGGGTIAYILANKGMDVIDCGVPVLSMHAPYEVTSKFDVYCAYETYKAFWN